MEARITYQFKAWVWRHGANGGWHFVSLPKGVSKEIRENLQWQEEGWGRMRAKAMIMDVEWDTAIWFDKKMDTYLLPLKAEIRKKLKIELDDEIEVSVFI